MPKEKNNFAVFDIEANDWIKFEVMALYDGNDYRTFSSPNRFLSYIDQKAYRGFTFFAHNAGKYDDLFLLEDMFARGWNPRILERGGRIILIQCTTEHAGTLRFADSYALLPSSQANLSDSFNVEHDKIAFDFRKHKVSVHNKQLMKRLENDCKGMHEILTKFFDSDFVENPKLTIASQALDTFKERFLSGTLQQTRIEYEDIFREAFYAGGRVEVFKGTGKVNVYDVNSLYPFAMLNEMPTGECNETSRFIPDKIGFYEVEILSTPNFYIPPYLIKGEKNLYVNGRGKYFLSSETILFLKKEYGIRFRTNWGLYFKGRDYIFNDYVNFFFAKKAQAKKIGDTAMTYISKLFLNSLYGKLGAKREHDKIERFKGQKNFAVFDSDLADHLGLVLVKDRSRSRFILPYLAAYITDLARLHHFKIMRQVEPYTFYCDTDSIFTSQVMPTGDGIGELSLQGSFTGVFLNPKTYALKNKEDEIVKLKGFSAGFTYKDFDKVMHGKKVLSQTGTRILSFRDCLRRKNNILSTEGAFLNLVSTTKRATNKYDKRKMLPDDDYFFDTKAFTFGEAFRPINILPKGKK